MLPSALPGDLGGVQEVDSDLEETSGVQVDGDVGDVGGGMGLGTKS